LASHGCRLDRFFHTVGVLLKMKALVLSFSAFSAVVLLFLVYGCEKVNNVSLPQNHDEKLSDLGQVPDFRLESATGGTFSPDQLQ
jgi:hypothetical protein